MTMKRCVMEAKWKTTTDHIVRLFRSSLVALVPTMEQARIPWRGSEAYDDWDEIAGILYKNIVARSLQWAIGADTALEDLLPPYNIIVSSYSKRNIMQVLAPDFAESPAAFIGFSTAAEPFDVVDCLRIDANGRAIGEVVNCSLDQVSFCFYHRASGLIFNEIVVEL